MEEPPLIQNYERTLAFIALRNSFTTAFRRVQDRVLDLEKFNNLKDLLDFEIPFYNC
jgi:hypothetical protein